MIISSCHSFMEIYNDLSRNSMEVNGSSYEESHRSLAQHVIQKEKKLPALVSAFYHPCYRHYPFSQHDTNSRPRGICFNRIAKYMSLSIITQILMCNFVRMTMLVVAPYVKYKGAVHKKNVLVNDRFFFTNMKLRILFGSELLKGSPDNVKRQDLKMHFS